MKSCFLKLWIENPDFIILKIFYLLVSHYVSYTQSVILKNMEKEQHKVFFSKFLQMHGRAINFVLEFTIPYLVSARLVDRTIFLTPRRGLSNI